MTEWTYVPAKTREVFDFLKTCAKEMRTVTYAEVAEEVGLAKPGVGKPLGYIRDRVCRERGLSWLNAIAVSQRTGVPSEGFLPEGVTMGTDETVLWRGMVLHVFGYDWSDVTFD